MTAAALSPKNGNPPPGVAVASVTWVFCVSMAGSLVTAAKGSRATLRSECAAPLMLPSPLAGERSHGRHNDEELVRVPLTQQNSLSVGRSPLPQGFCLTLPRNSSVAQKVRRWLQNITASQNSDGLLPTMIVALGRLWAASPIKNGTPAFCSACRICPPAGSSVWNRTRPVHISPRGISFWPTTQRASANVFRISLAYRADSGSPINAISNGAGNLDNSSTNILCWFCVIRRLATFSRNSAVCFSDSAARRCASAAPRRASAVRSLAIAIAAFAFAMSAFAMPIFASASERADASSFAAAIWYRSNASLDSASSIRCNLTTAQVAAPAMSAKNPATIKNTTIAFSQPCSDKPSIRLTLFEKLAMGAIALLSFAFVVLGICVIWDLCRGSKCPPA